jgi:CSLREA domain-containing protein
LQLLIQDIASLATFGGSSSGQLLVNCGGLSFKNFAKGENTMSKYMIRFGVLISMLFSLLAVTPVTPASAGGVIVVNTNTSNILNDSLCTLREAITAANTDAAYKGCSAGSGTDTITFAANYTITLTNQLPNITTAMVISGKGVTNTIVQGAATPGSATKRLFFVTSTGNITLKNMTLRNGRCNGTCASSGTTSSVKDGGAIYLNKGKLTLSSVALTGNIATGTGGGIYGDAGSTLTITNSTISSNSAGDDGGALFLYNMTTTIKGSTFNGNSTTGAIAFSDGGAIYNLASGGTGTLTVSNSTFSGNSATAGSGGAIHNNANGVSPSGTAVVTITNSTIVENSAGGTNYYGGGLFNMVSSGTLSTAPMKLYNTIVYGNTVAAGGDDPNCRAMNNGASIITNSNNLFEDSANDCPAGASDVTSTDALSTIVGPLDSNGGATQTRALGISSPALDAGKDSTCAAAPISNLDQRGIARPQGAHCDIGAYEYIPTELLRNGGFNDYPDGTNKIPTGWTAANFGAGDGKTTTVTQEGTASVKITGASGANKKFLQSVPVAGSAGEKLAFSFWVRGSNIPSGGTSVCRGLVIFYNSTVIVGTTAVNCPTGTFGFQKKTVSITAPAAFTMVTVKFTYTGTSGTVWFDLASLMK